MPYGQARRLPAAGAIDRMVRALESRFAESAASVACWK